MLLLANKLCRDFKIGFIFEQMGGKTG